MAGKLNLNVKHLAQDTSQDDSAGSLLTVSSDNTIRFAKDAVQSHIQKWMQQDPSKFCYEGIFELKKRALNGTLRQGQIIFKEVSVSEHIDVDNVRGFFTDLLAPLLTLFKTGQSRKFAYFHCAVYVGEYKDKFYVVENGGCAEDGGYGTISLETFEDAFIEEDKPSKFFVVSPPRDEEGSTIRYIVMQRALASLGVKYRYNIRAVSCETFATAMFGNDQVSLNPIQDGIIRVEKKDVNEERTLRHVDYYKRFHSDLYKQISMVPMDVMGTLTIHEYIDRPDKNITPWFHQFNLAQLRTGLKIRKDFCKHEINGATWYVRQRYIDLEFIGSGSFGFVVKAVDSLTQDYGGNCNLKVAIKTFRRPFQSTVHAAKVYRELRILRHMQHENVLGLLNCFTPEKTLDCFRSVYLVIPLMEANLNAVITQLTDEHIQYILYQLLSGLKYMHSAGIVHGDLKPSNIGINEDCKLRILDFGFSRFVDDTLTGYVAHRWYRPPEVLLGICHAHNYSIDIWSVGCIIGEMITGKPLLIPTLDTISSNSSIHLILRIISLCGAPNKEMISRIPDTNNRYFISWLKSERANFKVKFSETDPSLIDIMEQMMQIDPKDRIDVNAAIAHPCLRLYYDPDNEPTAATYVPSFDDCELPLNAWKEKIWEEVNDMGS